MLAELIDAVVGVDTHRDTHEVELALPTGTPIGIRRISNDNAGFAELLAWILDHAPGRGWLSRLKARAASVSGWPARSLPPA
jgi:hypothetical protein